MTEEDQVLVAKAALAGVTFKCGPKDDFWRWSDSAGPKPGAWASIGRAAAASLFVKGFMPQEEYEEYRDRTGAAEMNSLDSTPPLERLA